MHKIINIQNDIQNGIYLLEIFSDINFIIQHGKFDSIEFSSGFYYYIGSAQKNLVKRINRHLKLNKTRHWHIDYLTSQKELSIKNVYVFNYENKKFECELVNQLQTKFKLKHPAKGFGNSDCNNCYSHLLYSSNQIAYSQLFSLYHSIVRLIPSSSSTF